MTNAPSLRIHQRKQLRSADLVGLAAGAAFLVGVLSVVMVVAPGFKQTSARVSAEDIAENARAAANKAALAHREGTILFVETDTCHEHSFDNWTGAIEFKDKVDCDERLAKLRKPDADRAAERMRNVVEGFRR